MHILHIATAISWRGGEQQLAYLIEEMRGKGVSQTVFCFKDSEIEKYCKAQNIAAVVVKKSSPFNPLLQFSLSRNCKKTHVDLIHAHDSHAHTLAVLSSVFFNLNTPIVISRKVDFPIRSNFFSRFKYNYPAVKKIICVSQKINAIIALEIENKSVLTTIYDGIDFSRFESTASGILRREYGISEDELIIGNVAAIASHKDYFTFVDVAELLVSKKIKAKFLIVGDGPDRSKIENYIAQKNLQSTIITGFRSDIPKILPEFDLFLFTSKTEGLGSSILDAYCCSVPVVATRAGGIPEIVIDEKTGLLAPVQNSNLLAAGLMRIIENPGLKTELISAAKEWVKNFSKEKNAALTFTVYKEIMA